MRFALFGLLLAAVIFILSGGHIVFLPLSSCSRSAGCSATVAGTGGSSVRLAVAVALAAVLCLPAAATASSSTHRATLAAFHPATERVAFRSHLGFGRLRGRSYGFGGVSRRRGHSFVRRAVKTAIWLYILHLFFSHGGLSILLWVIIIAIVMSFARRRRRRYAYWSQR